MATDENASSETTLDRVMDDIRQELVTRVAREDREDNRDVYDALENE